MTPRRWCLDAPPLHYTLVAMSRPVTVTVTLRRVPSLTSLKRHVIAVLSRDTAVRHNVWGDTFIEVRVQAVRL